jgi:hypothetical protein
MSNLLPKVAFTLTATFVQVFAGKPDIEHGDEGRLIVVPKLFTSKVIYRQ